MEDNTQIKINVGPLEETSVEVTPVIDETETEETTIIQEPPTIPIEIDGKRETLPLDDDVELVSPDLEIFNRVTENVTKKLSHDGYTVTWHGTEKDSSDDFEIDETFASTINADKKFMEVFGIGETGTVKVGTEKEISTVNELDSSQHNIESDNYEYTERLQNKEINEMYDYALGGITRKLFFSLFAFLLLFLVENITLFSSNPQGIFDISAHPYIHTFTSIILLIVCSSFAYEQIYHGFKSIIAKDYIPEAVGVVALLVALIHNVFTIVTISFGSTPRPMNSVVALIMCGTLVFTLINIRREKFGFRVILTKESKFILEKVQESDAESEFDTFTTTTNGEFNGEIARVGRTAFVKNYFYNTNSSVDLRGYLDAYLLIVLIVPIVFAIISLFREYSFVSAVNYWCVGVLAMLPIGILTSYSIPFFIGNSRLFKDSVAVIGEEGVTEFADVDIVAVNDTTIFPPSNVKLKNFNVYNGYTIEKVLYYASNGFSIVGGPLAEVFEAAVNDSMPKSKKVKFVCTGRSYLCVKVDSDKVIFADKFGMTSQGIEVGNEREEKDDVSIMYIAVNGALCAKMYVKYELDEEFIRIARFLNKNGTTIGVRTFDPNLSNELIRRISNFKKDDVRIIKLSSTDEVQAPTQKSNAKIVSNGLSRALIKAVPVCKRIINSRKVIRAIKILASILSAVGLAFWVFGKIFIGLSAYVVGYHLAVFLIMLLATFAIMPKVK